MSHNNDLALLVALLGGTVFLYVLYIAVILWGLRALFRFIVGLTRRERYYREQMYHEQGIIPYEQSREYRQRHLSQTVWIIFAIIIALYFFGGHGANKPATTIPAQHHTIA